MRLANIIPNRKKACKKLKRFPGFTIAEINAVTVPSFIEADISLFDEQRVKEFPGTLVRQGNYNTRAICSDLCAIKAYVPGGAKQDLDPPLSCRADRV